MTPCIEWTGRSNGNGYGRMRDGRYPHRVAYEAVKGPIPTGLQIDHLCRNRACCNPEHLEAVTQAENLRRGMSPSALHAKKTQCPKGHPYNAENTYRSPAGSRICRICMRERDRARWPVRSLERKRKQAARKQVADPSATKAKA